LQVGPLLAYAHDENFVFDHYYLVAEIAYAWHRAVLFNSLFS